MAEQNVIWTVGRRKQAIARVRLLSGNGEIEVNKKPLDTPYIKGVVERIDYKTIYYIKEKKNPKEYTYEVILYNPTVYSDLKKCYISEIAFLVPL